MMASTGRPLSSSPRYLTSAAGDSRARATARQPATRPRSTAGRPEAMTSRRIDSSSCQAYSRIGVRLSVTFPSLPEVDLQGLAIPPRRYVPESLPVVPVVDHAAVQQVVNLLHAVAGLLRAGCTQVIGVRKYAHARHDGIPGKNRITLAEGLLPHGRRDALAAHPQRIELLELVRQVQNSRVGAPVLCVGARIGLEVRHDVVTRAFEMLVDAAVVALTRLLAKVALFQDLDKGRCRLLYEQQRSRLQGFDEALRQPHRQAIPVPVLRDPTNLHLEMACRRIRLEQPESPAQLLFRLVRRTELRAIDIAIAIAARQRNPPGPAMPQRCRHRLGGDRTVDGRRERHRRVIEQVV